MMRSRRIATALALVACVVVALGAGASSAFAGEAHPFLFSFGALTNPNGIAVDEATGDVYVATLGSEVGADQQQTVTIGGEPTGGSFTLEFEGETVTLALIEGSSPTEPIAPSAGEVEVALASLSKIGLGSVTVSQKGVLPAAVTYTIDFQGALAAESVPKLACSGGLTARSGGHFPNPSCTVASFTTTGAVYKFDPNGSPVEFSALHSDALSGSATPAGSFSLPNEHGSGAAIAVDDSTDRSDPSRGDLYVLDAGHKAIDKFSPSGEYISQISGPFEVGQFAEEGELVGLAVEANGDVRVADQPTDGGNVKVVKVFDDSVTNDFVTAFEVNGNEGEAAAKRGLERGGFAVGPTGASYMRFECGCVEKFGNGITMTPLGRVDNGPGDVAMAVDPVSGHVYVDEQSSVVEWDTGGMDGYDYNKLEPGSDESLPSASEASSFGSGRLSPVPAGQQEQGGIAVNGANGEIYVSNPADGKVYAFASTPPAVAAGAAANVTQTSATLRGSVDPRGVAVSSCRVEYEKSPPSKELTFPAPIDVFTHSVACAQTPAEIGAGASPVAVSAEISGLEAGALYYFRVAAGNADGESSSEGMFATKSTGFGIKRFSVSFLNQDGTPDTQAGSHPYEMVTSFEFNTEPEREIASAESPYELLPAGSVKDILVTLPPGFFGNPNATDAKCTINELQSGGCSQGATVGELFLKTGRAYGNGTYVLSNMVPPRGVAAQFGTNILGFPNAFINAGLQTGGQYPLQAGSVDITQIEPLYSIRTTLLGVVGNGQNRKPFLTLPSHCTGPLRSSISVDSYQEPGKYVAKSEVSRNVAGEPVALSGCAQLKFPASITVAPDVSDASSSSGLTVGVDVPQTAAFNPEGLAESALRDTTVALPAGVAINPAGGDGLEACSEGLAGFTGAEEFNKESEPGVTWDTFKPEPIESLTPGVSFCPDGSKIGTVKIKTPLLPNPLEGAVYLASQDANPFGSLIAMYMLVEDPVSGSTIKLAGEVRLCENTGEAIGGMNCEAAGQIITTFLNTPDLPFEELELHFFGGERAPLSTPSHCGTYTTQAIFTPWDGNAPVHSESSFEIEHGPNGSPCPGAALPFNPTATAGATNIQAGEFTPFEFTMSRADGEQNLASGEVKLPPGLSGVLSGVELCPEPQANEGLCGAGSLIGETTVSVGVGSQPFTVRGGRVYLTGPYNGQGSCVVGTPGCAPFGLSIVNPAKAGPFDLANTPGNHPPCDCVLVRAKIEINPLTAAITIRSNPAGSSDSIPTMLAGIPLQIQHVNVTTTRSNFQFNPTNCSKMQAVGVLHSAEGSTDTIAVPFQATNCASLKFQPKFSVSTSGKTSRANGASLTAKLSYPAGSLGRDANIAKVKVDLPKQLPSRLTTLQKACPAGTFEADPADCPADSRVGHAKAVVPILPVPLTGPAYFVSHGGAKFPELVVVLQGYGVTIDLHGETFISKAGITSSTFSAVPDQPVTSFELTLPEGKYSALAANGDLCKSKLAMPTAFVAQNGAEIHESTKIGVTGCPKSKKAKAKGKTKGKRSKKKGKAKK